MENWGLVTYRETNLLYDPLTSSNGNKETTATIIAHELAHMVSIFLFFFYPVLCAEVFSWSRPFACPCVWCSGSETW